MHLAIIDSHGWPANRYVGLARRPSRGHSNIQSSPRLEEHTPHVAAASGDALSFALFPAKEHENERQDNADYETGGKGKVEGNVAASNQEITRQPSYPGYLASQNQEHTETGDHEPQCNECFTKLKESVHLTSPQPPTVVSASLPVGI